MCMLFPWLDLSNIGYGTSHDTAQYQPVEQSREVAEQLSESGYWIR